MSQPHAASTAHPKSDNKTKNPLLNCMGRHRRGGPSSRSWKLVGSYHIDLEQEQPTADRTPVFSVTKNCNRCQGEGMQGKGGRKDVPGRAAMWQGGSLIPATSRADEAWRSRIRHQGLCWRKNSPQSSLRCTGEERRGTGKLQKRTRSP